MPTTFKEVQSRNPEIVAIDDPEWNIAAGIYYDRQLWNHVKRIEQSLARMDPGGRVVK